MNILVINGAYRPAGTTAELAQAFLEGARSAGAEADMIRLADRTIGPCTDCLLCYRFEGEGAAPCSRRDDMDAIVARIAEADGILFASPVHNGFVSGRMTAFWERLSWRAARPGGRFLNCMSIRSRLTGKVRALGAIVSAGGMPERLRRFCDDGTDWLRGNAPLILHGQWIGDLYAGAELERLPACEADWRRLYLLRRLSGRQRQRARDLGGAMVRALRSGRLHPVTMESMVHPVVRWSLERLFAFRSPYRLAAGGGGPEADGPRPAAP